MSDLDSLVARATSAGVLRPYKFGSVPKPPVGQDMAYPYAVLSLVPGAPQVRMLDGSGEPMGRFTVQVFARSADTLHDQAKALFDAFDGVELSEFDGAPVCWQELATAPYRDPDTAGVLDITHTYRF